MSEICPRCNQLGSRFVRVINGRRYLYFRHYDSESKRVRQCYIGPIDGYEYVEKLHSLRLTNVLDQNYIDIAILSIVRAAERLARENRISYEDSIEIILKRLFRNLERYRRAIENAYRDVFK